MPCSYICPDEETCVVVFFFYGFEWEDGEAAEVRGGGVKCVLMDGCCAGSDGDVV